MWIQAIRNREFDLKFDKVQYYFCPLYCNALREKLELDFQNSGLIIYIPLKIGSVKTASFWIKRGTSLLC